MASTNSQTALNSRLDDLSGWLASHPGARPSAYIDRDERERSLAYFLTRTRRADAAGRANPAVTGRLDEILPGWRITLKSPEHWDARLAVAHEQQDRTTRIPPRFPDFGSKDPQVVSTAQWALASWRGSAYGCADEPSRRERLQEVNGWTEPRRGHQPIDLERVRQLARQCADFHARHGRAASQTGAEPGEPRLGSWLSQQRRLAKAGASCWTPQREEILDAEYPAWRVDEDRYDWAGAVADLVEYRRTHGRLPRNDGSRLGRWVGKRRHELVTGARNLTAERVALLDENLPGWRDGVGRAA